MQYHWTTCWMVAAAMLGAACCAHASESLYWANGRQPLKDRTDVVIAAASGWVLAIYRTGADNDIDSFDELARGAAGADDALVCQVAYTGATVAGYFARTFSTAQGQPPSALGLQPGDRIYTRVFDSTNIATAQACAVIDDTPVTAPDYTYPPGIGWHYDPGDLAASDWVLISANRLTAPSAFSASDGTYSNKVRLTWNAVTNASGYRIWRAPTDSTNAAAFLAESAQTTYDDPAVTNGATYYYWIQATNAVAVGAFSASDAGSCFAAAPPAPPPAVVPSAPTDVAAGDGTLTNRVRVTWSAVSNATAYEVWRHTANDTAAAGKLAGTAETVFDDTTALAGTVYFYWVKATNAAGASGFSHPDSGYAGASGEAVRGGTAVNDYDGDGISDLAVFGTTNAGWYVRSMAGSNIAWGTPWGWPGALPVPGDYDGDGKNDLAVFDGNSGAWYVQSVSGTVIAWAAQWGWLGALPVPGDYDGDGTSDYPVFDRDTGNWYILSDSGSLISWATHWGWPGALPVPGDYDGDGKNDLAVYDAASGRWFVESVSGALLAWSLEWGGATLNPVSGDFDGDGRSDLAVFDQGTGIWFIRTMSGEILAWAWAWGWPGASALAGDYDGDGVSDAALYDSNVGTWYIGTLTNTVLGWQVLWGGPGFVPVGE